MGVETKGISYVVPIYNEEGAIRGTLERLDGILAGIGLPYEIIAVNDGSKDQSLQIAAAIPGVRVLSHPVNCGYGAALKTGIRSARYGWIGIVDADGTYPIEELPRLVERMEQGFDMVVARRSNVLELDIPLKRFFRTLFIRVVSLLVDKKVEDPNSGFRIFRRELAATFLPFLCNAYSFTTSITVFAFGQGRFISYVPVEYSVRTGHSKVRHVRDSLRTAQLVMQGLMFFNPAKFSLLAGLAFLMFGLMPAALLTAMGFTTGAWLVFWSTAVFCVLVLMGMLFDMLRIAIIQSSRDDVRCSVE